VLLLPLRTGTIVPGTDLVAALTNAIMDAGEMLLLQDVLVISSKVVALSEGRCIDLTTLAPGAEATDLAGKIRTRSPAFCEAVLRELDDRQGRLLGTCDGAALTSIHDILIPNAGLDESNAPRGCAVGWPEDAPRSAEKLRLALENTLQQVVSEKTRNEERGTRNSPRLGVIVSDSGCVPRRRGVIALALACSGLSPFSDARGGADLEGRPLTLTVEATADQLAVAANHLMGNAGASIPAVLIRGARVVLKNWTGWIPPISVAEDLFRDILKA